MLHVVFNRKKNTFEKIRKQRVYHTYLTPCIIEPVKSTILYICIRNHYSNGNYHACAEYYKLYYLYITIMCIVVFVWSITFYPTQIFVKRYTYCIKWPHSYHCYCCLKIEKISVFPSIKSLEINVK
jgi:hypothetical protein